MRTLWENITKVHKGFGKQYRFDIDDKYLSTQGNLNGGMHVPIVRVDLVFKEVLAKHIKFVNGGVRDEVDHKHKCDRYVLKHFRGNLELLTHINVVHEGKANYKCHKCDKKYRC